MNTITNNTLSTETLTIGLKQKSRSKWVANFAKSQILKRLNHLQTGCLTIIDQHEKHIFGHPNGVDATITVHDARFYGEIAFGGSIGAGEAYMLGYWTADNLSNVIRLMCVNQ
ncbi:MAG: SAM-dependent methyltransferase, partial [Pseudomonadota bacterium]